MSRLFLQSGSSEVDVKSEVKIEGSKSSVGRDSVMALSGRCMGESVWVEGDVDEIFFSSLAN